MKTLKLVAADGFSTEVREDHPAYPLLKRFVGDTLYVEDSTQLPVIKAGENESSRFNSSRRESHPPIAVEPPKSLLVVPTGLEHLLEKNDGPQVPVKRELLPTLESLDWLDPKSTLKQVLENQENTFFGDNDFVRASLMNDEDADFVLLRANGANMYIGRQFL